MSPALPLAIAVPAGRQHPDHRQDPRDTDQINIIAAENSPQLIMIRAIQRRAPTRGMIIPDGTSSSA